MNAQERKAEDLARAAYEAYKAEARGVNHQGLPLPAWEQLGDRVQASWRAAVQVIVSLVRP